MKHLIITIITVVTFTGCYINDNVPTNNNRVPRVNEYELGRVSYSKGQYERAAQYQTQWIIKYPDDANAYTERGKAYNKMNKSDTALLDFSKASELSSDYLTPRIYKSAELAKLGNREEASILLEETMSHPAFTSVPSYEKFIAYSLDGQFKMKNNSHEEALLSLNNALRVFNSNTSGFVARDSAYINRLVIYNRAVVYNKLGDYGRAASDMEAYVAISGKANVKIDSKDYARLAIAYYLAEEYKKCKAVLKYVSEEDRKMLADTLDEEMFYDK